MTEFAGQAAGRSRTAPALGRARRRLSAAAGRPRSGDGSRRLLVRRERGPGSTSRFRPPSTMRPRHRRRPPPRRPCPHWPQLFGSAELARLADLTAARQFRCRGGGGAHPAGRRPDRHHQRAALSRRSLVEQRRPHPSRRRRPARQACRAPAAPSPPTASASASRPATRSTSGAATGSPASPATQNAVATRFARDTLVLTQVASVANSYFSLLSAQDRLKIADDNLKEARFGSRGHQGPARRSAP